MILLASGLTKLSTISSYDYAESGQTVCLMKVIKAVNELHNILHLARYNGNVKQTDDCSIISFISTLLFRTHHCSAKPTGAFKFAAAHHKIAATTCIHSFMRIFMTLCTCVCTRMYVIVCFCLFTTKHVLFAILIFTAFVHVGLLHKIILLLFCMLFSYSFCA